MKTLITLIIFAFLTGCAATSVTKSGPFTVIEKHPDQEKNLKEAPESIGPCDWVIPGTPSASACEKKEAK